MDLIREISTYTLGFSGIGLVSQVVPIVPDDFKSWSAVAILGFITLSMLGVLFFTVRVGAKNMSELANSLGRISEQEGERGRRSDELCRKLGETNQQIATTNERLGLIDANLKARPCIINNNPNR